MSETLATRTFICILCPLGCDLAVTHDSEHLIEVRGNRCVRGEEYAEREVFNPVRTVTTTVRIEGARGCLLPVKTAGPVAKAACGDVVRVLASMVVRAPVRLGDVVMKDVCATGADVLATRSMGSEERTK